MLHSSNSKNHARCHIFVRLADDVPLFFDVLGKMEFF